ncbi:unnamed protein product [Meganyctiphanes norvegica]|uniref:Uncharacterized protein n=1 Tax=Meganyctiphanes norvegica TaxID=48144 RepID=A0AAV2RXS1_MEGNR
MEQAVLSVHCGWFSMAQAAHKFSLDTDLIKYHVALKAHFSTNGMEPTLTLMDERIVAMRIFIICQTKKYVKNWQRCKKSDKNFKVIYKNADSIDICIFLNLLLHVLIKNKDRKGIQKLSWEWVKSFLNRHSYLRVLAYVNAKNLKISMCATGLSIEADRNRVTAQVLDSAFKKSSNVEQEYLNSEPQDCLRPKLFEEWKSSLPLTFSNISTKSRAQDAAVANPVSLNALVVDPTSYADQANDIYHTSCSSLSTDTAKSLSEKQPSNIFSTSATMQNYYANQIGGVTKAGLVAHIPNSIKPINAIQATTQNVGLQAKPTNTTKECSSLIPSLDKNTVNHVGKDSKSITKVKFSGQQQNPTQNFNKNKRYESNTQLLTNSSEQCQSSATYVGLASSINTSALQGVKANSIPTLDATYNLPSVSNTGSKNTILPDPLRLLFNQKVFSDVSESYRIMNPKISASEANTASNASKQMLLGTTTTTGSNRKITIPINASSKILKSNAAISAPTTSEESVEQKLIGNTTGTNKRITTPLNDSSIIPKSNATSSSLIIPGITPMLKSPGTYNGSHQKIRTQINAPFKFSKTKSKETNTSMIISEVTSNLTASGTKTYIKPKLTAEKASTNNARSVLEGGIINEDGVITNVIYAKDPKNPGKTHKFFIKTLLHNDGKTCKYLYKENIKTNKLIGIKEFKATENSGELN